MRKNPDITPRSLLCINIYRRYIYIYTRTGKSHHYRTISGRKKKRFNPPTHFGVTTESASSLSNTVLVTQPKPINGQRVCASWSIFLRGCTYICCLALLTRWFSDSAIPRSRRKRVEFRPRIVFFVDSQPENSCAFFEHDANSTRDDRSSNHPKYEKVLTNNPEILEFFFWSQHRNRKSKLFCFERCFGSK